MILRTDKTVRARVEEIVRQQFGFRKHIEDTMLLDKDLGGDSLDHVEFTMAIEDEFGIELPDETAFGLRSVGDWVRHVEQLASAAANKP